MPHSMVKRTRPLKFNNAQEVEDTCSKYFQERKALKLPYTITGLALALDTTRDTLMQYEKEYRDKAEAGEYSEEQAIIFKEISDTIKKNKAICESYAEDRLFDGKTTIGAIFALKNYGWKDKQELEVNDSSTRVLFSPDQYKAIIEREAKKLGEDAQEDQHNA